MADITLKDGTEVTFDLDAMTWPEYTTFRTGNLDTDGDYALLSKVTGLSVEQVRGLGAVQFRRLVRGLFKKATEPLADPN